MWVSRAYQEGFKGAQRDTLIGLGTAPLDDPFFRAATFEQLGEPRLEAAVTTDICGKRESHATRLDREAVDTIKKARLHRKVATAIFFESNGGQLQTEATVPEIRLAVAEPGLDIGNVETVLETSSSACYFLSVERNRYRFSLAPNLNKILADRRANISPEDIEKCMRAETQKVFPAVTGVERVFFPENSSKVLDRPILTLVILAPDQSMQDEKNVVQLVDAMTRECGTSSRTFKSALIWCVADSSSALREEARKLLAWEAIQDEADTLRLDEGQTRQLAENLKKAQRDLREAVWRTYKNLLLLGKDNTMRLVDLGLVHSSAADTMVTLILNRLRQDGDVEKDISPNFLTRNWPPAFTEWSTKSVREMFFASPQFPKLLNADVIKETITRGVEGGLLGYVGKAPRGGYYPFCYSTTLSANDIEIAEDMFIITKEMAERYKAEQGRRAPDPSPSPDKGEGDGSTTIVTPSPSGSGSDTSKVPPPGPPMVTNMKWSGEIPPQRWMNFYTKVLSKFATGQGLKLTLSVEVSPDGGIPGQKIEETRVALRELGLDDDIETT